MARSDAPRYRRATGANTCATCVHFRTAKADSPVGWCEPFNFAANKGYTCDEWEETEQKEVSSTPTAVMAHGPGGLFSSMGLLGAMQEKRKAYRGHTTAMIALDLQTDDARKLALKIDGALDWSELHITLVFLGPIAEFAEQKAKLLRVVMEFARETKSITGTINGAGRFVNGDEGAWVYFFDSPELPAIRQRLCEKLESAGIAYAQNHGFIPHITVAYRKPDEIPTLSPPTDMRLDFNQVRFYWGDDIVSFPLLGEEPTATQTKESKSYTPPTAVRAAARRGLALRQKYGRGGLSTQEAGEQGIGSGVARATNLANGDGITLDTIKRMVAFFSRHEKNKNTPPEKGNGKISWLLWGGDPGRAWAEAIVRREEGKSMKEKPMKTEIDGMHPADHYLVVEDKEKPSTWHLRVRNMDGKLDRRLMGGARAALTVGYRGNKYEGPQKMQAIRKLQKLYDEAGVTEKPGMIGGAHGPSVKNPKVYEALRRRGYSKGRSAAISNAMANKSPYPATAQKSSFTVFKDKNGKYRWVTISSNAYRDRDGEIVSIKALADDVARADKEKDYGTLRFWHMPGIDIGDCDFNMMHGKTLIESGTFRDEYIAKKVAEKAADYQVSIGFRHPPDEPSSSGVFKTIRRFERSLVPAGRAANPFTAISVRG